MTRTEVRQAQQYLRHTNHRAPDRLTEVPKEQWPKMTVLPDEQRIAVWRSKRFLVQAYMEGQLIRLSINRTMIDGSGRWIDGISWDELQAIKEECGYGECDAVEIFPRTCDVVNVANMRHLWVFAAPLAFAWRNGNSIPS